MQTYPIQWVKQFAAKTERHGGIAVESKPLEASAIANEIAQKEGWTFAMV
ncbi:hypothetical protein MNBD_ALPHA04-2426 [hydrothermal vent metagenome]|uniref:Uncharacterized protein n=1 Tax=hydrothermal vent metagenome TaxID=652676 RepID=A0A3B0RZ29_9ZZZZ